MLKTVFILLLGVFIYNTAFAQKDTVVYYLKNSGKQVSSKDSADYFRVILPPDTSVDKTLFIVRDYYPTGKTRLIAGSLNNNVILMLNGPYVLYFPNGHKMKIGNFENGKPVGDIIEFYPNGKFYNKKSFSKTVTEETELLLENCSDSTGTTLAENGNGKWIEYNNDFTKIVNSGYIRNGHRSADWGVEHTNDAGVIGADTLGANTKDMGSTIPNDSLYVKVDVAPEFVNGLDEFGKMIGRNIRYPLNARIKGTQGRVIISFIVERDGHLTNIKVARGVGNGLDEEALRVMKLSPPWKPGMQNGKAVRVAYSVPISFVLSQ